MAHPFKSNRLSIYDRTPEHLRPLLFAPGFRRSVRGESGNARVPDLGIPYDVCRTRPAARTRALHQRQHEPACHLAPHLRINFDWDLRDTNYRRGGNCASTNQWKLHVNSLANHCYYDVLPDISVNAALLREGPTFNRVADSRAYRSQIKVDPHAQYHAAPVALVSVR